MSKVYFGISRSKGSKTVVGVVANGAPNSRPATPEEVRAIIEVIRPASLRARWPRHQQEQWQAMQAHKAKAATAEMEG